MSNDEKINKSYYAIIPANVRYDEELNPSAKLLYGEITALTNEKGYCWASNEYFAQLYKTSTRTVRRWVSDLSNKGYISVQIIYKDGSKEVEQRQLWLVPPAVNNVPSSGQKCPKSPDKNVPRGEDKNVPRGEDKNVLENNTVLSNITSFNNTKNNTDERYIVELDSTEHLKGIIDYLNGKTGKQFKYVESTFKLIRTLIKAGYTLDDFKYVIDNKTSQWLKDDNMNKYLRPSTLFNQTKFESYLNEKPKKMTTKDISIDFSNRKVFGGK